MEPRQGAEPDVGVLALVLAAFRADDVARSGTIAKEKLQRIMKLIAGPEMTEASVAMLLDELQKRFSAGSTLLHYEPALAWLFGQSRATTAAEAQRGAVQLAPGREEEPVLELESGEHLEVFVDIAFRLGGVDFQNLANEEEALSTALQRLFAERGGVEEHFVDVFLFGDGEVSCQVYLPEFASRQDADAVAKSLATLDTAKLLEAVRNVPNIGTSLSLEGRVNVSVAERMTTSLCRRTTRTTLLLPVLEEADEDGEQS